MVPVANTTVAAQGIVKLTDAFKNKAVISGLVNSLSASVQDLETVSYQVLLARNIATATGDALTQMALMVNVPRNGRTDAQLRAAATLQILVDGSHGRAEDLLAAARAMFGAVNYLEYRTAAWLIEAAYVDPTVIDVATAVSLLKQASPVGVHGVLHIGTYHGAYNLNLGSVHVTPSPTFGLLNSVHGMPGGSFYSLLFSSRQVA